MHGQTLIVSLFPHFFAIFACQRAATRRGRSCRFRSRSRLQKNKHHLNHQRLAIAGLM